MSRAAQDLRAAREDALRSLFATLERQGRKRVWMAQQLGIPRKRLWSYEHGEVRIPHSALDSMCAILGISPDLVLDTHGRNLVIRPESLTPRNPRKRGTPDERSAQPQPRTKPRPRKAPDATPKQDKQDKQGDRAERRPPARSRR